MSLADFPSEKLGSSLGAGAGLRTGVSEAGLTVSPIPWIGPIAVGIQAALFWFIPGNTPAVMASIVLCLFAAFLPERYRIQKRTHLVVLFVLASIFGFAGLAGLIEGTDLMVLLRYFAGFLLMLQAVELLREERERRHNYMPGLACLAFVVLILSSFPDERPLFYEYAHFLIISVVFLLLRPDLPRLLMNGVTGNLLSQGLARWKGLFLVAIFLCSLLMGGLFYEEVRRDVPVVRRAFGNLRVDESVASLRGGSAARFVRSVELGDFSLSDSKSPEQVVFTVEADTPPGYMRTLTFSKFDGRSWSNTRVQVDTTGLGQLNNLLSTELESGTQHVETALGFGQWFPLSQSVLSKSAMVVEVLEGNGRLVPLPVDCTAVAGRTQFPGRLRLSQDGTVVAGSLVNARYVAFAGDGVPFRMDEANSWELVQLPRDDREFLADLAAEIFSQSSMPDVSKLSSVGAANRVTEYLTSNFEYSLQMQAALSEQTRGRSRLRTFLEDRMAAHCEYFATAATLLLRAGGYKSRLSTGYMVYELNDETDNFEAKNRRAHAWAEVYDERDSQWKIVEATPGIREFIESFGEGSEENRRAANDTGLDRAAGFWVTLENSLRSVWGTIASWLGSRYAWLGPVLVMGCIWLLMRWLGPRDIGAKSLSQSVINADRVAKHFGFERLANETCMQFAKRLTVDAGNQLQPLAQWYQMHSELHYSQRLSTESKTLAQGESPSERELNPRAPTIRQLKKRDASPFVSS